MPCWQVLLLGTMILSIIGLAAGIGYLTLLTGIPCANVCVCVNHLNRCKTLNFQFTKAGASGPSYLPDATKLWYEGEG